MPSGDGLFDLPADTRVPRRKVVLVAGASGSGKTSIVRRVGLPVIHLDDFYFDADHPALPRRHGIVDWDSPATWDAGSALDCLLVACTTDRVEIPLYDIPTSRRTGTQALDLADAPAVLAEGIFAAEIAGRLATEGILADAIYLAQPRLVTAVRRFARDVGESRKPLPALVRRGVSLTRSEPTMMARWRECGLRAVPVNEAEASLRSYLAR